MNFEQFLERATRSVDIYCERTDASLLSEPLNAVSNIAFFIAAYVALRMARAAGKTDTPMMTLIWLTAAVGLGSTLWHIFAQRWAGALDVLSILLFILAYFGLTVWRYFGARAAEAVALSVAFLFFAGGLQSAAAASLPPMFSPTIGYLPALVALLACGLLLALRRRPVGWWLLGAGAAFAVSLTFRSLDMAVCHDHPEGTHYAWHLMNGVVLWLLLAAWLRHGARAVAPPAAAA